MAFRRLAHGETIQHGDEIDRYSGEWMAPPRLKLGQSLNGAPFSLGGLEIDKPTCRPVFDSLLRRLLNRPSCWIIEYRFTTKQGHEDSREESEAGKSPQSLN